MELAQAQAALGRLRPLHIFKGLKDDEILAFAMRLQTEQHPAGKVIFSEGDEGQTFYLIERGQVKVTRGSGEAARRVATLVAGDFFGEAALLYGRRRSATITAEGDVSLLCLSREDFDDLLRRLPQIKPNLLVDAESREIYAGLKLDWLSPSEVVYLIVRRHPILLWQRQLPVAGAAVLALIVAGAAWWYFDLRLALFALLVGGLPTAGWLVWNYLDWSNDYYIVTNERIVYLEKIIGIYDSRQEAPLRSIQSVSTETAGTLERTLGIGDVTVRTFSGPIVMKSVSNPAGLAALIEEHWNRSKTRQREAEADALKQAVRRRIGLGPEPPARPADLPAPPPWQVPRPDSGQPPLASPPRFARAGTRQGIAGTGAPPAPRPSVASAALADAFSFQLRYQRGDTITYRKHWIVLLQAIWQPSLFLLADLGLIGLKLAGILPPEMPWGVVLLVTLVVFLPLAFWWWYQFEDWKNDLYQISGDQVIDVYRRPFGQEERRAAPLANVLGLKFERPGLIGYLLNYGTVIINIPGQPFDFEGVFDPVGVQNDIYRRLESLSTRKAEAEAARRREELADWVGVYHRVVTEANEEAKRAQKPPDTGNPE